MSAGGPPRHRRGAFAAVWGKSGDVRARRDDFLDACVGYADELRVRQAPDEGSLGSMVLEDCRKLTLARDGIVDGVGLEAGIMPESKFTELLVEVLERLLELKSRPVELSRWQDDWFGAHAVFVYEFLYVVASLLQAGRLEVLHAMFRTHYLKPRAERYGAGTDSARFMGTVGLLAKRCARWPWQVHQCCGGVGQALGDETRHRLRRTHRGRAPRVSGDPGRRRCVVVSGDAALLGLWAGA